MKPTSVLLTFILLASTATYARTSNILLIGFWPPTNDLLRKFSPSQKQNPKGWQGKNWENQGYDIYAYFPDFKFFSLSRAGIGDFRVDYAAVYNSFFKAINELHPVAIIGFGEGDWYDWRMEMNYRPYFKSMFQSGVIPSDVGENVRYPIPDELKSGNTYSSSLPDKDIVAAINSLQGYPVDASINNEGDASNYTCGFQAYLIGWYQAAHLNPEDPNHVGAAGFIHVRGSPRSAVA